MSLILSVVWSDTLYLNKKLMLKVENFQKYESSRWPSIGGRLQFLNVEPQVETQCLTARLIDKVAMKQAFLQVSSVFSYNHLVQRWLSFYSDQTMDWPDGELWFSFQHRQEIFFYKASRPTVEPTSPIQRVPGSHSLGVRQPENIADHLPPSTAKDKMTAAIPTPSQMSQCMLTNNFTFTHQ